MIKEIQMPLASRHKRLRYGFGAACMAIAALLFLLSFQEGAAKGLEAPLAPTIIKSSDTSIVETNNAGHQAVAGELVTVTVVYSGSFGETLYDVSPRVALQDGLYPIGSNPGWSAMYTGTTAILRGHEGLGNVVQRNGALVIFPDQGMLTGTDVITMEVYAVRTQNLYVGTAAIGHNVNLRVQGILRYCDVSGCPEPAAFNNDDTSAQVNAIQPALNVTYTPAPVYLDAAGIGAGGENVRLTFNTLNANGRPYAHDIVYTATLGAGLAYQASSSNGPDAGTSVVSGDMTYVVWHVPSLQANQSWQGVVTATLPATFTIGQLFDYSAGVMFETFAGDVPYEGKYLTPGANQTLRPGLSTTTKVSIPGSGAVTMGDRITYTVVFQQGANTLLQAPQMVDTQPLGFHYITDTFALNATYTTFVTEAGGTGNVYQNLRWVMADLTPISDVRVVTATYTVLNTGLNYDGVPVHAAAAEIRASRPSVSGVTGAVLSWTPPAGSNYNVSTRANAGALGVIQPFLGDNFTTSRTDFGDREIGQSVLLAIRFHNLGMLVSGKAIPAHELEICDTLPIGLVFNQDNGCFVSGTTTCPFTYTPPAIGDTGTVCWQIPELERTTTYYEFRYQAGIGPTTSPGAHTNGAHVTTYSSQPSVVEGERIYSEFPEGLPTAHCGADCITVLGLAGDKQPSASTVVPGERLTYTLTFTDTSLLNNYTNLIAIDTYDSLLTYVSATPEPTSHNSQARQLRWDLPVVPQNGNWQVVVVMQVADVVPDGVDTLLNTLSWDSDQTLPYTIMREVAIQSANLNLAMDGPSNVHADQTIAYTIAYSHTGTITSAPVTLTLDYGDYVDYVDYVSASATRVPETENVFVDTITVGQNYLLTVQLRVKTPLPYDLAGPLQASASLVSPGAESKQAGISLILDRPVLILEKTGPAVAPSPGSIAEYTIRVQNLGTYTATGAVITDTWGANLGYRTNNSSFGWVLSGDETYATQSLGTLGVGEIVTKFFQVDILTLAISYTNQIDLTTQQTTQQSEIEQTWQASIATTKSVTPVPAFPGRVLTYTVYYTSTANYPMVNALVTDTLPSNFVYLGQSTAQASGCQSPWTFTAPVSGGGGNAVWSCATLFTGASGRFTIWGEVKTEAEGTNLTNRTTTSALDTPIRPIEKPLVTRVARPWLRVDKSVVPAHPVAPGDWLTYTLTYENDGTDPAYNVIIKDQLPAQVAFVSCSGGSSCNHTDGLVTWNLGQVPVGTVGSVKVVVEVNPATAGQTAVNADYSIQSDRLPVAETITGPAVSSVILDPHLTAEKLAEPASVTQAADRITYTIGLTNDGGGILHNVVITDAIDARTIVDQPTLPPECVVSGEAGANELVTCNIGTLAQAALRVVQFKVYLTGSPSPGDSVTNTAYHHSDETPFASSNETTVWVTTGCIPPHDVDFTVSANPQAGQPLTFTASAAGDMPMTFAWVFGDTQTGSGQIVEHTYAVSGTYKVDLTVSNGCVAPVTVSKDVFAPGAPEIVWTPPSFTKSADEGSVTPLQDALTVSNTGTANLIWSVSVMTPAEATWLRIAIGAGDPETVILPQVTVPGYSTPVTVYFNPAGLAAGTYSAQLRIESNDTDEGVVLIPVTFTIRAPDEDYYIYLPLVLRNAQ